MDDKPLFTWQGNPDSLSVEPPWAMPMKRTLFLGCNSRNAFRVSALEFLPVTGQGQYLEEAELDLLQAIDWNVKKPPDGTWTFTGAALVTRDFHQPIDLRHVPYHPGPEYDLRLQVERKFEAVGYFGLGLVVGGKQVIAHIDRRIDGKPPCACLENVDNDRLITVFLPGGPCLQKDRPSDLVCKVRKTGITLSVDGKRVIDWTGDPNRLSVHNHFVMPDKKALFLASGSSDFRVTKFEVLPAIGPGKEPRNAPGDFRPLLNGVDLTGWEPVGKGNWSVVDGVLKADGTGRGWLATQAEYADFELKLEYRLPPKGNSGIFPRSWKSVAKAEDFVEVQLLDDATFPTLNPTMKTGSIFKRVAPNPVPRAPAGQWHRARVKVDGAHYQVWINDVQVVDADVPRPESAGQIGLQVYDTAVEFRNLWVREVPSTAGNH